MGERSTVENVIYDHLHVYLYVSTERTPTPSDFISDLKRSLSIYIIYFDGPKFWNFYKMDSKSRLGN